MANPTWTPAGGSPVALTSAAARDMPDPPDVRVFRESLPGVDGEFAQGNGRGGRDVRFAGVLRASGGSASAAASQLKSDIRSRQALATGAGLGTYVGEDAHSYANCVFLSFGAGPPRIEKRGGTYYAHSRVSGTVRQLACDT